MKHHQASYFDIKSKVTSSIYSNSNVSSKLHIRLVQLVVQGRLLCFTQIQSCNVKDVI